MLRSLRSLQGREGNCDYKTTVSPKKPTSFPGILGRPPGNAYRGVRGLIPYRGQVPAEMPLVTCSQEEFSTERRLAM